MNFLSAVSIVFVNCLFAVCASVGGGSCAILSSMYAVKAVQFALL